MNRKFPGFVHVCSLPEEKDILHTFFPGENKVSEFLRRFRRSMTITSQSTLAMRYFKSHRAIESERTRHLQSHFYVIHPYSVFSQRWNYFMLGLYLFAYLYIPFYVSFINISPQKHNYVLYMIVDCIQCTLFLADIFVNVFTGYVKPTTSKTQIVLVPWKIFWNYSFRFCIDLISSLPLDHILCFLNVECYVLCFLPEIRFILKFVVFFTFRNYYYQLTGKLGFNLVIAEVGFFCMTLLIVIHVVGSLQNWLSTVLVTELDTTPWTISTEIYANHLSTIYFVSFSYGASVFLNLDFSFGPPHSTVDKMFTAIVSFFGGFMYVIVVAKVIQWAQIVWAASRKYEEMELQLKSFMRYRKLPRFLQKRINTFYEFRFQESYFQESTILPLLSSSLREDIMMHSCRRMVQNVSFFHGIPMSMLLRVVVRLRPEIFLVNDVIIKAGTHGNCMYFITSGTVAIYSSSGKEICHLEDGAHLGEVALVIEEAIRVSSVVAVESCELQRLDRADFKRVVAPYPDLAMRIERIAEERLEMSVAFDEFHRRTIRKREPKW